MHWNRTCGFDRRIPASAALLVLLAVAPAAAQEEPLASDTLGSGTPGVARLLDARDIPVELVRAYADPFLLGQGYDGGYTLPPNVQTHLKAEMGMVLAAQATGDIRYAESARRDLLWIIKNRMEPGGGIDWTGPDNPYFFEVHQHWFLIASEMIRQALGGPDSLRSVQRRAWLYLLQNNQASADFYYDNLAHHGTFFAYRSLDRHGHFQSQAPFKGSYEVGAALWSLSLHLGHSWLDVGPGTAPGHTVRQYLDRLVAQTQLPPSQRGFFDGEKSCWVRSLLWSGADWSGWETHDNKYALHAAEGALLYTLLSGRGELLDEGRKDLEDLLVRIGPEGMVRGIPDAYGTPAYEYGEAMSVLGLGAQIAWGPTPEVGNHSLEAARKVFAYAAQSFPPAVTEDRAVLLLGMCRVFQADQIARATLALGGTGAGIAPAAAALTVSPNPMSDRTTVAYALAPQTAGSLRIVDVGGRELRSIVIGSSNSDGRFLWDGRDARGHILPSGQYRAVLEDGRTRWSTGISIIR